MSGTNTIANSVYEAVREIVGGRGNTRMVVEETFVRVISRIKFDPNERRAMDDYFNRVEGAVSHITNNITLRIERQTDSSALAWIVCTVKDNNNHQTASTG